MKVDGVKDACVCVVLVYFCRQTDTPPTRTHTDTHTLHTHRAGSPQISSETTIMMKVKSAAGSAADSLSDLLTSLFCQQIQCITRFMSVTETLVHRTRILICL